MDALLDQLKRLWPNGSWAVSYYGKNNYVGYISNGEIFGNIKFASGLGEGKSPAQALNRALANIFHKEYELSLETPEPKKKRR